MRGAVILAGVVDNVIEYQDGYAVLPPYILVPLGLEQQVDPGWSYSSGTFSPPNQDDQPDSPTPVDVVSQIAALQAWAKDIQNQVDAATEILMGGLA